MSNRRIPYGYEMQKGIIQICEYESNVLKYIFNEYINGNPLNKIAEDLTARKIEFMPEQYTWNKNRVKRIIEDKRYLGDDKYPQIIDKVIFAKDNIVKINSRRTDNYNVTPENKLILKIARCAVCGSPIYHRTDSRSKNSEIWRCRTSDCKISVPMSLDELQSSITELLNQVIVSQNILDTSGQHSESGYSIEIMRMEKDIERQLASGDFDKEKLQNLILECAMKKYNEYTNVQHITERLKAEFEKSSLLSAFSIDLFEKTVSVVMINKNSSVSIMLKDGTIVGKENRDAGTDHNTKKSCSDTT